MPNNIPVSLSAFNGNTAANAIINTPLQVRSVPLAFVASVPYPISRLGAHAKQSHMSALSLGPKESKSLSLRKVEQGHNHGSHLLQAKKGKEDLESDARLETDSPAKNPIQQHFTDMINTVERVVDCCKEIVAKGTDSVDNVANPVELLFRLAEKRAGVDERNNPVIKTALMVAAMKSAAGAIPEDKLTPRLVGPWLMAGMSTLVNAMPKLFKELGVTSRTPWLDSRIEQILVKENIKQVVLLGAGLDTRAQRMPILKGVDLYELDLPEMVAAKESLFQQVEQEEGVLLPQFPNSLVRIPSDLSNPKWIDDLQAGGFDPQQPTLFVLEGVIYYFEPEMAKSLGNQIHSLSATGSHLLFDCINEASIKQSQFDKLVGKPAMFNCGIDEPESWLEEVGYDDAIVLQPGEEGANFGLFDEKDVQQKGFHRTHLNSFDRYVHALPRDQVAPDGKEVRRFFFAEGVVKK